MRGIVLIVILPWLLGATAAAAAPARTFLAATKTTMPATRPAKNTWATNPSATTAVSRRATTAATRKSTSDVGVAAVRGAVAALSKEYEKYLRDPTSSVRESSNYFLDYPDPAVTPDAVAQALGGRGGEPRTTAYVRWQLLSALPEGDAELPEAVSRAMLVAYRTAPPPIPRPGIAPHEQKQFDALTRGKKLEHEPDVKGEADAAVSAVARQNVAILRYRDELYRRLPKTPETFAAALEDLAQRMNAVADGKDQVKALAKDVREWAAGPDATPPQLVAIARAARRLADSRGPQYYQSPYWSTANNVFQWRKTRTGIDTGHALKDLAVFLEEMSQQPVIEIKK